LLIGREARKRENRKKERTTRERKMGFLMNFVSLMDISNQESEVLSLVQTSAVSVIPLGPRLYGIMWNEKNFEGSRRILCQNLPGVNQCMKAPDKDSQLRNILVEI
jgi:hypothetical protein